LGKLLNKVIQQRLLARENFVSSENYLHL